MGEREFSEIVRVSCNHPTVYTFNGTFTEVVIFLEGFAIGARVGGLKHRDAHSKFTPFFQWLAAGRGQQYSGNRWEDFRASYPDDAAALNGLARSYREYAEAVDVSDGMIDG